MGTKNLQLLLIPFFFVILVEAWASDDKHCGVGREYWGKCETDTFLITAQHNSSTVHTHKKIEKNIWSQRTNCEKQQLFNWRSRLSAGSVQCIAAVSFIAQLISALLQVGSPNSTQPVASATNISKTIGDSSFPH